MSATHTTNLGLNKPDRQDYVSVVTDINDNMDILDSKIGAVPSGETVEGQIGAKVPTTRKINNKALSSDVTIMGSDIPMNSLDNTKLDVAVGDLKSALSLISDSELIQINVIVPSMTRGSYIDRATGEIKSATKYARTNALWSGHDGKSAIKMDSNTYEISLIFYDENGVLSTGAGFLRSSGNYTNDYIYIPYDAVYIAADFRRIDQNYLVDADLPAMASALKFYRATDETLSKKNYPAEAYETGAKIKTLDENISKSIFVANNELLTWEQGGINADGTPAEISYAIRTGKIKTSIGAKYSFTGTEKTSGNVPYVAWIAEYDTESDSSFVKRTVMYGATSGHTTVKVGSPYVKFIYSHASSSGVDVIPSEGSLFMLNVQSALEAEITEQIANTFGTSLVSAVPANGGVQAAILRARQMTDIMYTPTATIPCIRNVNGTYEKTYLQPGVRYKGIPYSRTMGDDTQVGMNVSLDTFATAVLNPNGLLHTRDLDNVAQLAVTYYGIVCSKLVQYAWGLPLLYPSQHIEEMPGLTKIADPGEFDENDIQLGDGILNPATHCTIVTDILTHPITKNVIAIEISEAVTPTCRRIVWNVHDFFQHFDGYGLYRYDNIANVKYKKSKYIDLEDGLDAETDFPILPRPGNWFNTPKNSNPKADVDSSKWTTIHDVVNGTDRTDPISSDVINLPTSRKGYHEVYPTDSNGNKGNSIFYYSCEAIITHSSNGNQLTVTYDTGSVSPSKALFVQWDNAATYNVTFLENTGEETVTIPSGATKFRIAFESDFGVWYSSFANI